MRSPIIFSHQYKAGKSPVAAQQDQANDPHHQAIGQLLTQAKALGIAAPAASIPVELKAPVRRPRSP